MISSARRRKVGAIEVAVTGHRFCRLQCEGCRDCNDPTYWFSAREAAAGVAFHASRAGCDGRWQEALEVRDEDSLRAELRDFNALLRMYREPQGKQQEAK